MSNFNVQSYLRPTRITVSQRDTQQPQWEIYFPFDLRTNRAALSDPAKIAALKGLFPGTTIIAADKMFLYFCFSAALPPKPWPGRIAGLPVYFAFGTFDARNTPLPPLRHSHPGNGNLGEGMDGRDMEDWEPLFRLVKEYFQIIQVAITEVMYWHHFLIIVLERPAADGTRLPYTAGRIPCYYLEEGCMCRPAAAAQPSQACRVASTGICTIGAPRKAEYHIPGPGAQISPLLSAVESGNNGQGPAAGLSQKLAAIKQLVPGELVWLGSLIPATYMHSSRQRVVSDDPSARGYKWVKTMWVYGGQDSPWEALTDLLCGSTIWTENGDAVGYFRYMIRDGPMKDWGVGHCSG